MIYYKGKPQSAAASAYDLAKAKGYTGTEEEFAIVLATAGNKADKATTLSGYGITDAYTKTEVYSKTEVNEMIGGAGGVVVSTSAPSKTNVLWIDTGNGGIAKYYDTSSKAWTTVKSVWG